MYSDIRMEILMQIRSTKKIQSEVSLQDPIGVDREGNEFPSCSCIPSGMLELSKLRIYVNCKIIF